MSAELRALRSKDGRVSSVAFSDALVPISEVYDHLEAPVPCKLQTRASAEASPNQRRYEQGRFLLYRNGSIIEETAEFSVKSTVGPFVVVHSGVKVDEAKILAGAELEDGVEVGFRSEICEGALVGSATKIGQNCRVGERSQVGASGTVIASKIGPHSTVGDRASISRSEISGAFTAGSGLVLAKANIFSSVKVGDTFEAGPDLEIRDGSTFGHNALLGANVRIAPGVHAANSCKVEDRTTVDDGVTVGSGVLVGERCRIDVGASLRDKTTVGENSYIGPFIEIDGEIAPGSYIAYRKTPIPVWPIPKRTFEITTESS